MVHRPLHWREDEHFVYRQVQLDAWRVACPTERTAISQTTLGRLTAARIGEDFELARLGRKLQAAGVVDPLTDFLENIGKEGLVKVIGILQREVQIFGKAVGFEVALLQACTTLEDPPVTDRRVLRPALFPTPRSKPFEVETTGLSSTARGVTRTWNSAGRRPYGISFGGFRQGASGS